MTTASMPRGWSHPFGFLLLVTRAAWVSSEFSTKCAGASRSFPAPLPFLHYALLAQLKCLPGSMIKLSASVKIMAMPMEYNLNTIKIIIVVFPILAVSSMCPVQDGVKFEEFCPT